MDLNRHLILSKADARYADTFSVGGRDLIQGLTYNNYPTLQDVYNTTPAWSFPYLRFFVAPVPAQTLLEGGLATQAGGIGLYDLFNNLIYAEVSLYRTAANGFTQPLSAGVVTTRFVNHLAPYWRVALQHVQQRHSFSVGTYGMETSVFLGRNTNGPTSFITDLGFDSD